MEKEKGLEDCDVTEIEKDDEHYEEEVNSEYDDADEQKESMKNTSRYTTEDWDRITIRAEEINQKIIKNMDKGAADPVVQDAVEEFRQHITENFYNCTPEILLGMAELYINDAHFSENIDKNKPGLAKFFSDAIFIYCRNLM
ncbi:MAG TPA: hypothetical protein DEP72_03305 [Clostridiales bacterium]|nr:MAG: hypothetical protein A2Y18_07425 [Clostridiales bacterium GWD2_32_19]HCC07180.1 hypothetical protein [Clostridiales bacterium]